MGSIFSIFSGYKTYIAAVGLLGLSVYNLSVGDFTAAGNNLLLALAAIGLRHAVTAQTQQVLKITDNQTNRIEQIVDKQVQEMKSAR